MQVGVVVWTSACGAAVTPQVGCNDVETFRGQRRHDLAPGIRKLGKSVQEQHAGTVRSFEPGFQDMDAKTVDPFDEAGPNARWEYRPDPMA